MKTMKKNRQRPHRGLTLVEVMIVLFIIVMIAGIGVVAIQGQRNMAQQRTALAYINVLRSAVDRFDADVGRVPTTQEGLTALVSLPPGVPEGRWGGPYIRVDASNLDPWGNEYQYVAPGRNGAPFDIWSFGPDMMNGTDDDIGTWTRQ